MPFSFKSIRTFWAFGLWSSSSRLRDPDSGYVLMMLAIICTQESESFCANVKMTFRAVFICKDNHGQAQVSQSSRFCFFKICNVKAHIRAHNTQCITRGARDKRGGKGKHKTVGNRDMRRSVERVRDGAGNTGCTRWTLQGLSGPYMTGTFRKENREFEGGGFGMY